MEENYIIIPLLIEDEDKKLIKHTDMTLRIAQQEDGKLLEAVIPEGVFSAYITLKSWLEAKLLEYDDDKWVQKMHSTLPIDQSEKTDDSDNTLTLKAKLAMSAESYSNGELKEEFDLVDNHITIFIQTTDELTQTYGKIRLTETEDPVDVLEWVKSLVRIKDLVSEKYKHSKDTNESLEFQTKEYKRLAERVKENSQQIEANMMETFSMLLSSKKKKIVQLTTNNDALKDANKKWVQSNRSKLDNLILNSQQIEKIPEELRPELNKKRKKGSTPGAKRSKKAGAIEVKQESQLTDSDTDNSTDKEATEEEEDNDTVSQNSEATEIETDSDCEDNGLELGMQDIEQSKNTQANSSHKPTRVIETGENQNTYLGKSDQVDEDTEISEGSSSE